MIAPAKDRRAKHGPRRGCCAVEMAGLDVVYGRNLVLHNIGIAVEEGETIAITGPNGAGKSTLLKCMVGAIRPTSGSVSWFNQATSCSDGVRRQIGYVGQDCGLYAELTAVENLLFAGRMYGIGNISNRVAALLSEAGIESQVHRPVGQLSQGMRQRLAIARALVHDPQFIVLDEPSSNLDAAGRQWLEERLFRRWRDEGRAVCFASHDVGLVHRLADRIAHLNAGRLSAIEPDSSSPSMLRRSA